jgi:hypothetical protein
MPEVYRAAVMRLEINGIATSLKVSNQVKPGLSMEVKASSHTVFSGFCNTIQHTIFAIRNVISQISPV